MQVYCVSTQSALGQTHSIFDGLYVLFVYQVHKFINTIIITLHR